MPTNDPLKQKRIFVGFNHAGASGIWQFSRILRRRGVKIDFYGINQERLGMKVDHLLRFSPNPLLSFFQRLITFFRILPLYKVWHLNFLEAFFFYPLNLLILKMFAKKIVLTFRGVEVRRNLDFLPLTVFEKADENWPEYYPKVFNQSKWRNLLKLIRMKIFIYFADAVILTGPFSAGQVDRFDEIIPYAREVDELKKYLFKKNHKKITILHVPTEPIVKGTPEIAKIFKKLEKKYQNVNFKILPTMDREHLLKELSQADIVIDQIIVGWYGGQAVEAMAMGKVVMAYLHPPYLAMVPYGKEIPIFNTNPWSLEQDLETLIKIFPEIKKDYQEKSLKFVKKYHDAKRIADEYLEIYKEVALHDP